MAPNLGGMTVAGSGGAAAIGGTGGAGGGTSGTGGSGGAAGMAPAGGTGGGGTSGAAGTAGAGATGGVGGGAGAGAIGGAGGAGGGTAQDVDCDMNGLWIARMLTITDALDLDQCASIYSFYEFRHEGANVEVVNHFNCGIAAKGSGTTSFRTETRAALLTANSQVGRKGTMTKGADGTCQLELEPFWAIIGADETFLPSARNSPETLQQQQAAKPLPMEPTAAGVVDFEGDGKPGVAFYVTESVADGTRHSIQRNVQTFKTDDFYKITPSTDWPSDIEARAAFFGEEVALEADNLFLYTIASPVPLADAARATMRFLGRDASDPRAQQVVVSMNPAETDAALQTCDNIVAALEVIRPVPNSVPQRCPCPSGMPSDQQRKCAP